jgi:hypothetical protein
MFITIVLVAVWIVHVLQGSCPLLHIALLAHHNSATHRTFWRDDMVWSVYSMQEHRQAVLRQLTQRRTQWDWREAPRLQVCALS